MLTFGSWLLSPSSAPPMPSAPAPPILPIKEKNAPQGVGLPPYEVQTEAPPKSWRDSGVLLDLNCPLRIPPQEPQLNSYCRQITQWAKAPIMGSKTTPSSNRDCPDASKTLCD